MKNLGYPRAPTTDRVRFVSFCRPLRAKVNKVCQEVALQKSIAKLWRSLSIFVALFTNIIYVLTLPTKMERDKKLNTRVRGRVRDLRARACARAKSKTIC